MQGSGPRELNLCDFVFLTHLLFVLCLSLLLFQPSKKFILSDPKLLRSLVEYDKDNMDPKVVKKIREFLMMPEFAIDKIKAVSRAAHSLCSWIYAIEAYDRVVKQVEPKKQVSYAHRLSLPCYHSHSARREWDGVKESMAACRHVLVSRTHGSLQSCSLLLLLLLLLLRVGFRR